MREREFDQFRPALFAIAYRMLGSVSEAEDVVQEGFLRLHRARTQGVFVESPRAYLSTIVSRLSLDQLRSARARREAYVGEWLPEPLPAAHDDDPAHKAETADSLSFAFLVLLESLSPEQRAAFLLHDIFDEPYPQVAEIIGTSTQNARQLAARARRYLRERRPRFEATQPQHQQLAERFFAAAEQGDLEALEQMLAHDVVLHGDGGGKAPAVKHPLCGRTNVARALITGLRTARARYGGFIRRSRQLSGQPGALLFDRHGRLASIVILDIADGQIQSVNAIDNPDKLRHLGPVSDLYKLPPEQR